MTTQTLVRKLNKEVSILQKDMKEVKKALFAASRDPEGEYTKSFIKKMQARAKEKPKYRFTGRDAFLKHVYGRNK